MVVAGLSNFPTGHVHPTHTFLEGIVVHQRVVHAETLLRLRVAGEAGVKVACFILTTVLQIAFQTLPVWCAVVAIFAFAKSVETLSVIDAFLDVSGMSGALAGDEDATFVMRKVPIHVQRISAVATEMIIKFIRILCWDKKIIYGHIN